MHALDDFREIVRPGQPLAPLTWFRLGGPAEWLARPRHLDELVALLARAREASIPVHILAGGSNVLVRDAGVPGLVVHLESPAFSDVVLGENAVEVGAAVPLMALISQTARAGLGGLEALTGIPGTVGGALRGNSGGRQGNIGSFVKRITVLDSQGRVQVRDRDDVDAGPDGLAPDDPIILSAELALTPDDPEAVVKRMRRIWIVKKEHQPYGHQSSGCIFRNVNSELTAGVIIEQAGLKGTTVGGAEVSDRHANFIVAHPGAAAADVLALIEVIRRRVREAFSRELELRIQVW